MAQNPEKAGALAGLETAANALAISLKDEATAQAQDEAAFVALTAVDEKANEASTQLDHARAFLTLRSLRLKMAVGAAKDIEGSAGQPYALVLAGAVRNTMQEAEGHRRNSQITLTKSRNALVTLEPSADEALTAADSAFSFRLSESGPHLQAANVEIPEATTAALRLTANVEDPDVETVKSNIQPVDAKMEEVTHAWFEGTDEAGRIREHARVMKAWVTFACTKFDDSLGESPQQTDLGESTAHLNELETALRSESLGVAAVRQASGRLVASLESAIETDIATLAVVRSVIGHLTTVRELYQGTIEPHGATVRANTQTTAGLTATTNLIRATRQAVEKL